MKTNLTTWAPIAGKWEFEGPTATYIGPEDPNLPYGIALSRLRLRSDSISTKVSLYETELSSEVIKPVTEVMGLEAYRADDVYKPGIITYVFTAAFSNEKGQGTLSIRTVNGVVEAVPRHNIPTCSCMMHGCYERCE